MPIYEYLCEGCNLKFEVLKRNTDDEKVNCPKCGSEKVKRLFSTFGFSSGGKFVSSSSEGSACLACNLKNCDSCG
ncbi:MAG: zinc ribbon domain-containing protein [Candidatus Zixiibacteriota bacterium]